jgi:hypothetical protein
MAANGPSEVWAFLTKRDFILPPDVVRILHEFIVETLRRAQRINLRNMNKWAFNLRHQPMMPPFVGPNKFWPRERWYEEFVSELRMLMVRPSIEDSSYQGNYGPGF